jgi:hypothetical protein
MRADIDPAELTLKEPEFDGDGLLIWTEEVEDIYQATNDGTSAMVLIAKGPILLSGYDLRTEHRTWATRLLMDPSEADDGYPMRYRMMFQFQGEPKGQKMYPRLPFEHWFTGVIEGSAGIQKLLDSHLADVDAMAEEVYVEAVAGTRAAMAGHLDRLLKPKPWWQFW